jgi:hypothetical protein
MSGSLCSKNSVPFTCTLSIVIGLTVSSNKLWFPTVNEIDPLSVFIIDANL